MAGGRPTKFKPEFIEQASNYSLLGATNEDQAKFFRVSLPTLYKWAKENEEFSNALNQNKAMPDGKVAAKLFQRAMGYEYAETKTEGVLDPKTKKVVGTRVTKTIKQVAPDVAAQIFWLKNRRRAQWRDRWPEDDPVNTASTSGVILVPAATPDQWKATAAKQQEALKKAAKE